MMFSVNKEVLWNNVTLKGEKWRISWGAQQTITSDAPVMPHENRTGSTSDALASMQPPPQLTGFLNISAGLKCSILYERS